MTVRLFDLMLGLRNLGLGGVPVVAHASLSSFGQVEGGAQAVVNALQESFPSVLMPTFTYKTMVTPLTGPPDNGLTYGSGTDLNRMAEFFTPDMPADKLMGLVAETLRLQPNAERSSHPIQSFAGINASRFLAAQAMDDPLAPLGLLEQAGGWVLLLGVNHTVNTSIHYAERLSGRPQFTRWALTPSGVQACPGFPGDSSGFDTITSDLEGAARQVRIGGALIQAIPLTILFRAVINRIKKDPLALLCREAGCPRCGAVRKLSLKAV